MTLQDPVAQGSLYIGLMSGTSMDGIDAALVHLGEQSCDVVGVHAHPYPPALADQLRNAVRDPQHCTVDTIGHLDRWIGECFSDAATALLAKTKTDPTTVVAIGSHGQTVRHQPHAERPFTLQIGDANVIAERTGIPTVADFRRRDIAVGGEGAPLTPAFHAWLFADDDRCRIVLNIGGMANITILAPGQPVRGFDTGPGNTLLDAWIAEQQGQAFDKNGDWAAAGVSQSELLDLLLQDDYFAKPPPKSTGFEHFNLAWLHAIVGSLGKIEPCNVQATLAQLTTRTISDAISLYAPDASDVLVCGGGTKNGLLMAQLADLLPGQQVRQTDEFGLHADWVEAAAFAWLARQFMAAEPGSIPSVTGATRAVVLGSLFRGNQ